MDSSCVVEDEIVHQLAVEVVWILEQKGVVINELFLNRSIEPLKMCIHLRHLGIGMIMDEVQAQKFFGKSFLNSEPLSVRT